MAMRISARQVNGKELCLDVRPETTGEELQQQIKELAGRTWDEATRRTTVVAIALGDRLLGNDETVADAVDGAADAVVNVVFKENTVKCLDKYSIPHLSSEVDSELLLVVEIPSAKTAIPVNAFGGCRRLGKLRIPDTVTHIRDYAFQNCSSLASVTISNSVRHIGDGAFWNCSSLTRLTLPNSVTHIGASATISESVTHIGVRAFKNCVSLANLTMPDSVTFVGRDAFKNCSSLVERMIES